MAGHPTPTTDDPSLKAERRGDLATIRSLLPDLWPKREPGLRARL